MAEQYANFGTQTLTASLSGTSTATTWVVASNVGYPANGNFHVTIDNEICLVTAVTGSTQSGSRGQESTTITSHTAGAVVLHALTAGAMNQIRIDSQQLFTGSLPGTASNGDIWIPQDDNVISINNGTTFIPFGLTFGSMVGPATQTFTTLSSSTGTLVKAAMSETLIQGTGAANQWMSRGYAIPSTPYTISALFMPAAVTEPNMMFGMGVSDGTKFFNFVFNYYNPNGNFGVNEWSNGTTFSAWTTQVPIAAQIPYPFGMQMSDNGTTLIWAISADNLNWINIMTYTRTTYLTPTQVQWGLCNGNATWPMAVKCISWRQH